MTTKLVYYEMFGRIEDAITREKQLKKWNRAWKDKLINDFNPEQKDFHSPHSVLAKPMGASQGTLRAYVYKATLFYLTLNACKKNNT